MVSPAITSRVADVSSVKAYGRRAFAASLPEMLRSRTDQLVMVAVAQPAMLGVYAVATSVAAVAELLALTANQLAFPRFVTSARLRSVGGRLALGGAVVSAVSCCPS